VIVYGIKRTVYKKTVVVTYNDKIVNKKDKVI